VLIFNPHFLGGKILKIMRKINPISKELLLLLRVKAIENLQDD